jgi:hypothetical protein
MASDDGLKISFCTSCRGADYLERLKKTLPENIRRNTGDGNYNNVEFVVVAYGDPEVTKWLKENYADEIKSGLVRAVDLPREQAEFFKMAHAKNVAHRMATGDVLCNLDCDNITGENFSGFLNEKFSKTPDIVVCLTTRDKLISKLTTGVTPSDASGRVTISRENFEKLHGYNEQHNAARDDDTNFKERGYASGLRAVSIPASQLGEIITHSNEDRLANMSPADKAKSQFNFQVRGGLSQRVGTVKRVIWGEGNVIPRGITGANADGNYGCAVVTTLDHNLEPQEHSLEPAPHSQWRSSYRAGASGMQSAGGGHRE